MTRLEDLSLIKRIGIISFLLLAVFIIAGAISYFSVSLGDNATTARSRDWVIAAKIGFLYLLLPILSLTDGHKYLKPLSYMSLIFLLSQHIFERSRLHKSLILRVLSIIIV